MFVNIIVVHVVYHVGWLAVVASIVIVLGMIFNAVTYITHSEALAK